jgi:hypothetical protein
LSMTRQFLRRSMKKSPVVYESPFFPVQARLPAAGGHATPPLARRQRPRTHTFVRFGDLKVTLITRLLNRAPARKDSRGVAFIPSKAAMVESSEIFEVSESAADCKSGSLICCRHAPLVEWLFSSHNRSHHNYSRC